MIDGVRAAVFDGGRLAVVHDLEVAEPGPGQVTVRVLASGICHSDLHVLDGTNPVSAPVVPGHEAAGVVERLGPDVEGWAVGDAVAVHTLTPCGACRACRTGHPTACADAFGRGATPFRWHGAPVRAYANVSSFADHVTVRASQLIDTSGLAAAGAALLGCAAGTGYGAVRNAAGVGPGDRVAVLGVGGIGVNALQAARLLGAVEVVAVDVDPAREVAARRFGATRFALAGEDAGGPFDAVIECSGAQTAIEAALALTAPGGTTALVGIPPPGHHAALDVGALLRGRRVIGSLNGDVLPARDLCALVEHARAGRLDLDGQITQVWPLAEVDDAVAAVRAGQVVRAALDLT